MTCCCTFNKEVLLCSKLARLEVEAKLPWAQLNIDSFEVKCHLSLHIKTPTVNETAMQNCESGA